MFRHSEEASKEDACRFHQVMSRGLRGFLLVDPWLSQEDGASVLLWPKYSATSLWGVVGRLLTYGKDMVVTERALTFLQRG